MALGSRLLLFLGLVTALAAGLAARPPASRVAPFGEGVLSGGEVYRGSFTPDGTRFYFFKKVGPAEDYRIFVSVRTAGRWRTPERVTLGGEASDLYPAITRDGRRLVFSSYRPAPGAGDVKASAQLWYADRVGDAWGTPVFMRGVSAPGHYHSWVHVGYDDAVYFRRTTPDWATTTTMRTRWRGSAYEAPERYEDAERWKGWRRDVTVVGGLPGPDGTVVFLDVASRNPRTGAPASDIWAARRRGAGWSDPRPLGAGVNSDGFDVFPFFSPDGAELYFVRDFAAFYRVPLAAALASIE